jgi:hypothetical protein
MVNSIKYAAALMVVGAGGANAAVNPYGFTQYTPYAPEDTVIYSAPFPGDPNDRCVLYGVCIFNDQLHSPIPAQLAPTNYFLPDGNTFYYGGFLNTGKFGNGSSKIVYDSGNVRFGGFEGVNNLPPYGDPSIVNDEIDGIAGVNGKGNVALMTSGPYLTMDFTAYGDNYVGTIGFNGDGSLGQVSFLCTSATCPADVPGFASDVPEPASWALLMAGVGATGGALREARRRRALSLPV